MNDTSWQARCMALLMGMNSGQEWTGAQTQVYDLVLSVIGEEYAPRSVEWAVLNEEWRPSPARLRQIAARLASPYPDAEQSYAEILVMAQTVGLYGAQHPERPNIRLTGPPRFSHPVVAQITAYCGGWERICTGESNMEEGLRKQVRAAHGSVAGQWEQEVGRQLALPAGKRDVRYFPQWHPFEIPANWIADEDGLQALPAAEKFDYDLDDLAEPVKDVVSILANKFTMPGSEK